MNLLIITRKVDRNDSHAGHTYLWVRELARQLAPGRLEVLCLQAGDISGLPENVRVYSLGKEHGFGRFHRGVHFLVVVPGLLRKVDVVFCHQNPEYTIAVWPWAKVLHKHIVTWYTHGAVTWKTKAVARLANTVLTASEESFRVKSSNVKVVGHGIDLEQFKPLQDRSAHYGFHIISVGRISPVKDYETLLLASAKLRDEHRVNFKVDIFGEPALPIHKKYLEDLRLLRAKLALFKVVDFLGPIPNNQLSPYLQNADVLVSLSGTGSIDKVVLEAMAVDAQLLRPMKRFGTF